MEVFPFGLDILKLDDKGPYLKAFYKDEENWEYTIWFFFKSGNLVLHKDGGTGSGMKYIWNREGERIKA